MQNHPQITALNAAISANLAHSTHDRGQALDAVRRLEVAFIELGDTAYDIYEYHATSEAREFVARSSAMAKVDLVEALDW
jgi:hypothetical protein